MRRAANPAEFGPDKPITAVQADGRSVVVPDAHLLFSADFTRLGDDLLLTGPDGARVLVTGYFTAAEAPVLQSPDGAVLTPELVAALVGPLAPGQYAQVTLARAPALIGQVETLTGTAQAVRADARRWYDRARLLGRDARAGWRFHHDTKV